MASKMLTIDHDNKTEEKENIPNVLKIKHPLQNKWTFWYYRNDRSKNYADNLFKLSSFSTVEDFWSVYNHTKRVSTIPQGNDYCVFKDGIKPMWEESRNVSGGRWLLSLSRQGRFQELDNVWLELLLCLIGEGFNDESDSICGGIVNVRPKGDKICLWTAHANAEDECMSFGRIMKQRLNVHSDTLITYNSHSESYSRRAGTPKPRYAI